MSKSQTLTVLLFSLNSRIFAFEITSVFRIHTIPALTTVEGVIDYIAGIYDLGGALIPVIDLNLRFGHEPQPYRPHHHLLVVESEDGRVAVIADKVLEVAQGEALHLSYRRATRKEEAGLIHELDVDGEIVMLLDPDYLAAAELHLPLEEEEKGEGEERAAHLFAHPPSFASDLRPEEWQLLRERAKALALRDGKESEQRVAIAVISLSGEYFGIELTALQEFANIERVVPIPCCPPHIFGNMVLRGEVVTLVDLRSELQLPFTPEPLQMVVITALDKLLIGVPVQDVLEVLYVDRNRFLSVPIAVRNQEGGYTLGEVPFGNEMVTVIDLAAILARPELEVNDEP
ncbi:MAG: chemotaxis protein CheW [Gammaproteobacteria bacterium]|nr:chemotaxis protein CheW [Gammaproteobacteria bacterium]